MIIEEIFEFFRSLCDCCCPRPIIERPVGGRVLPGGRVYRRWRPDDYAWTDPRHDPNTGAFELARGTLGMATLPYREPRRDVASDAEFDLEAEFLRRREVYRKEV